MQKVDTLVQFHDRALSSPAWPERPEAKAGEVADDSALSAAIVRNHQYNTLLWREEDQARRHDVPAERIVASKRSIDVFNQRRNDAVEEIDAALLSLLEGGPRAPDARLHSETPGAMIDRLSILALKIFHMARQMERQDADAVHLSRCGDKLHKLRIQRRELAGCLRTLLAELQAGHAYFHAYLQFKMYNDPALNPWLSHGAAGRPTRPEASAAPEFPA